MDIPETIEIGQSKNSVPAIFKAKKINHTAPKKDGIIIRNYKLKAFNSIKECHTDGHKKLIKIMCKLDIG